MVYKEVSIVFDFGNSAIVKVYETYTNEERKALLESSKVAAVNRNAKLAMKDTTEIGFLAIVDDLKASGKSVTTEIIAEG